jgi:hypothetical protein
MIPWNYVYALKRTSTLTCKLQEPLLRRSVLVTVPLEGDVSANKDCVNRAVVLAEMQDVLSEQRPVRTEPIDFWAQAVRRTKVDVRQV